MAQGIAMWRGVLSAQQLAALSVVVGLVVATAVPLAAQPTDGSPAASTATSGPVTSAALASTSPSTTQATTGSTTVLGGNPSQPGSATSVPTATTNAPSTSEPADGEPIDDPLAGEGQGEEAPGIDTDIPPPQTYGGQGPYQAPEILWSSVAEAERKLERSREAKREAIAQVKALRLRNKHLMTERDALDGQTKATIDELDEALERYQGRAVGDYRLFAAGIGPEPADVISPSELGEVMQRRRGARLAAAALNVGRGELGRLGRLRQSLDGEASTLLDRLRLIADYRDEAEAAVTEAAEEIDQARIEFEAFRAGSEVFISGVVFPIGGTYGHPLIDSFGFPRMTGTDDEHWHEGIDIFAPRGTPLVAAERGIVTRIGSGRLGGLKLWLVGESGTEWYYAHLDSFAPGLFNGQLVAAGDLVGYVGNTGNAVGTPPHLHMQMHPNGGRPVNPYPLLNTVSDLEQRAIAEGTHVGWRYEPAVVASAVGQSDD